MPATEEAVKEFMREFEESELKGKEQLLSTTQVAPWAKTTIIPKVIENSTS